MIQPLTIKELDRIREKERPAREKALRERKSIPPEKKPLCYFEVGRYVGGDVTGPSGLYYAKQWFYEDGKEVSSKTLADGVDMHIIASELRAAVHATLDRKASGK